MNKCNVVIALAVTILFSGCKKNADSPGFFGNQSNRYKDSQNISLLAYPNGLNVHSDPKSGYYIVHQSKHMPKPQPSLIPPGSLLANQ